MVKRMLAPRAPSHGKLALETGVPQSTLSRWLRQATTLDDVTKKNSGRGGRRPGAGRPKGSKTRVPTRGTERTADEKLQIVLEAARLSDDELGAFLREKGIYELELKEWQQQMLDGLRAEPRPATRQATPAEVKRTRELERELRRQDKALAEAAALIVLKKKLPGSDGADSRSLAPSH